MYKQKKHEPLLGDAGDFADEDFEKPNDELEMADLEPLELEFMDKDKRREHCRVLGDSDEFTFSALVQDGKILH